MPRPVVRGATLDYLWVHIVSVERFAGTGQGGSRRFDAAENVSGLYVDKERFVVGANGEQILAAGVFSFGPDVAPIPLESRLTLPAQFGGRVVTVVSTSVLDTGSLPLPNYQQIGVV